MGRGEKTHTQFKDLQSIIYSRVIRTDFGMGGDLSPPIGGGHMGGDKGPMGGDRRVIRDKIWKYIK